MKSAQILREKITSGQVTLGLIVTMHFWLENFACRSSQPKRLCVSPVGASTGLRVEGFQWMPSGENQTATSGPSRS